MSLTFKFDTEDVEAYADFLDGPALEIIRQERMTAMRSSLGVFEDTVSSRTPANVGTLQNSISGNIRGSQLTIRGEVVSPLPYAAAVEYGRRPGKRPPIGPIKLWVSQVIKPPAKELDGIAFLIARAIGRWGTEEHRMFGRGFRAGLPYVQALWRKVPAKITKRLAKP